jgi:hypothetical protein
MVNWQLGMAPDIGGTFLKSFQQGQEQGRETASRNALATFASNPDDPQAMNALLPHLKPEQMFSVVQGRQKAQAEAAEAAKKQREATAKYVANAAFDIVTLPEAQRAAAWDAYIDQGAAQHPDLVQYKGQYTPQALQALVAEAGKSEEFSRYQRPTYVPIGEAGLAGFQYGVPIQQGGQTQNFAQGAPNQSAPAGSAPARPDPGSVPKPAGMTDAQIWAQAHEAVRNGANADDVFRRLQAWGMNP